MIRKLYALLKTHLLSRKIRKAQKATKAFSLAKFITQEGTPTRKSVGDPRQFPGIDTRIADFRNQIRDYAKSVGASKAKQKAVKIGVGNSLMDFLRGSSCQIDDRMNFGLAGACSPHMLYVMRAIAPMLAEAGLIVRALVIGCLKGNALLGHQEYDAAEADCKEALDGARGLWPGARIIVYGLPPVWDVYAMIYQETSRKKFEEWVQADADAVYLDILKRFAGRWGLYPTLEESLEGIHMTDVAKVGFDNMISDGLTAEAGSTI